MQSRVIFFLIPLIISTSCIKGKKVDSVLHNTTIHSCDENDHNFEAVAINDGKIIELGPERQILNKYRSEESLDLREEFVYPTFIDANFKLFDILIERLSISTNKVENINQLSYLIEKKLETFKEPIINLKNSKFTTKNLIDLVGKNFNSNKIYIQTKDSLIAINKKTIHYLNVKQIENFKDELLEQNFKTLKNIFIEIQQELLEHGFYEIIIHNCNPTELHFLQKLDKYLDLEYYLYLNFPLKQIKSEKLHLNGFHLSSQNTSLIEKFISYQKPLSFTSSFFKSKNQLIANKINTINQDHRWACIIDSNLNPTESNQLSELNIYPIIENQTNQIEKSNFLSCYSSSKNDPYSSLLHFIKDKEIEPKQKLKLLCSNGQKLILKERFLGNFEKNKYFNSVTIKDNLLKINTLDQLYIQKLFIKNKLIYQIE